MADFRLGRLKFNWRGAWAASTAYVIDDIVSFKGNTYVCVVNHTSASSEGAWASTDLNIGTPRWELHVPGIRIMGAWTPNTFYAVNDLISYGANQYLCTGDHTSAASEDLYYTNDINNWSLYTSGTRYQGDWTAGTWYKLNDIVKYGNTLYVTSTAHTSGIQFDETKFSVYLESVKFEDTWGAGTEYQPGDIVTFGGYTYIAKTINTGKQPNIYNVDITQGAAVTPADWNIVTTGFDVKGTYNNSTIYVPGDVVQYGGNTYVKIATGNAGVYPTDTLAWSLVASGLKWKGPWSSTTTYQINDVVSSTSASWVNLTAQNINIDPVADQSNTGGANWQALAQGESTLTLSNPGDILYRNSGGANVNLPIGNNGEVLTVDGAGLPSWLRNNWCANVFYVATDGTDDPAYGKNISKPWASIRYALSQIPAGSATSINTIFVKSGTYEEQLPLTVPAYTSIVGDNLRATVVKPDPNTQSTDPTPVENRFSTMWILSESTTLKDMIFKDMEGYEPAAGIDDYDITQATIRGVFLRLNPNTPILGKSPYITQCSAFSGRPIGTAANCTGGVGAIIDKSIYGQTTSNGSMLFDSFTQFHDLGVGFWCKDLGNAEIVSSFTYYCQVGYTCTGGGRIRSLVGNNSWGVYGAVSIGYDNGEVPVTGNVRGQRLNFIYDENSTLFVEGEEVVQGADNGVVDQSWNVTGGTTIAGQADQVYTAVASTSSGSGTGATFTVTRNALGSVSSVVAAVRGSGYETNEVLTIAAGDINDSTDLTITLSSVEDDFSVSNVNYARALVLYVQTDYLIIENITGSFLNDKPVYGDGAAAVVASQATARTAAGGATPAVEGVKGKIFPLTNLPLDSNGAPIFPKATGATQFLNVAGNSAYDDSGSYVIKDVVGATSAQNLFLTTLRQYDVPGNAPTDFDVHAIARSSNVATVTTGSGGSATNHGLSVGDVVTIVIANTAGTIRPFATGYSSSDTNVLGIRNGVLQRTVVTAVPSGTTFQYANTGSDTTIAAGDSLLTGSKVYLQGTSGGSTKAIHLGGTSVTLYNVSSETGGVNATGVTGLSNSDTTIPFSDASIGLLDQNGGAISAGANKFLLINNEMMNIQSVSSSGCTVTRGNEGTQAVAHADGSVIYYVQKAVDATTVRGDIDTAVLDIPTFSINNFDNNDIMKVDNEFFRIQTVNSPTIGRATIRFAQPKNINAGSSQAVEIRLRYSQVRMTGHDFLQIGTGSKANTNWPDQPQQDPDQTKEVKEGLPGRVYYVSSDQDGNFRVGEYFTVEQATGTATLDASAFNLSGLESLRLGTVGAELGVAINEFSSDKTLGGDFSRDGAVPTQLAVKSYVDGQTGGGISRDQPTIGVQSLTSAGTTATLTSFVIHNVKVGDSVIISGADQANYNGTFVVNNVSNDGLSFSYIMPGGAVTATGAITCLRKQRMTSDLEVEGLVEVNPTWNSASSVDALRINATNTQSGAGSALIRAQVGGADKFIVDKDGNITAQGDLTVNGDLTTISSTNLSIEDKTIVIASGGSTLANVDGAGLEFGTSAVSLKYVNGDGRINITGAGLGLNGPLQMGTQTAIGVDGSNNPVSLATTITSSSLTSVGELTGLAVAGKSKIQSVTEKVVIKSSGAGGNQTYSFDDGAIFYHPDATSDITPGFTNVPTDDNKAHSFVIIINQGGTARALTTSIGINGASYNVKWSGGNAPSGSASKNDVWNFTLINKGTAVSPDWIAYASKSDFA